MPLVALLFAAGCTKEPVTPEPNPDNKPDEPAVVTFTAQATNVLENGVSISISHDGTENDTYYGFYTTDLTSEAGTLIEAQVAELKESVSDLTQVLWKGKTLVRPVMNLTPATDYKYIVFGVKADGTVYGKEGVAEFKTLETEELKFEVNPAWTVSYDGKSVHNTYGLVDVISVATTSTEGYIIDVIDVESYETDGIEASFLASIDYIQSIIDQDVNNGYETTWDDMLYTENAQEYYNLKDGVSYYAVAIGVSSEGEPTGKYAITEAFTADPAPEASEDYSKWLGMWIITDQNDQQYPMILSMFDPDHTYAVTLVDGFYDARASYNDDKTMSFRSGTVRENVDFGQYGTGSVGFYGSGPIGADVYTITGTYAICTMTLDESGNSAAGDPTPVTLNLTNGETCTLTAMTYVGVVGNSLLSWPTTMIPEYALPLKSMTRYEESASLRVKNPVIAAAKRHRASFKSLDVTAAELQNAVSAK